MRIKLCGSRRLEDVAYMNEFKPDYAGFILSAGFKRSITAEQFYELEAMLDKDVKRVGVFVNESPEKLLKYADRLDVIQLHGDEDEKYVQHLRRNTDCELWKAVRAKSPEYIESAAALGCDKLLIDSFVEGMAGGTGQTADTDIINSISLSVPFFLAGGLNAENIERIIKETHPFGVDISSGIETNGFKDREKIRKIMSKVRSV